VYIIRYRYTPKCSDVYYYIDRMSRRKKLESTSDVLPAKRLLYFMPVNRVKSKMYLAITFTRMLFIEFLAVNIRLRFYDYVYIPYNSFIYKRSNNAMCRNKITENN